MPATYDKHGIKFLYPENWEIKDQQDAEYPYQVSLETPAGGMWSLNIFPPNGDTEKILDDSIAALKSQYEDIEFSTSSPKFGQFQTRGIEANFFCLDFVVAAHMMVVPTAEYDLLIWYQAESRELDKQRDVFNAVSMSLLQSMTPATFDASDE